MVEKSSLSKNKYQTVTFNSRLLFWYLVLFLYALNFFNVGELFPLLGLPYAVHVLTTSKVSKDFMTAVLALISFSVLYCVFLYFYGYESGFRLLGRLVYPTLFLTLGYGLTNEYKDILKYLFIINIGMAMYGLLSLFKSLRLYGSINNMMLIFGGRNVINFWGSGFMSATALTAFLSLSLVSLTAVFIKDIAKPIRIILLFLFTASAYAAFQTSSRTGVLLIAISLFITIFFKEKMNTKRIIRIFLFLGIIVILAFLYLSDAFGIKSYIESSLLYERLVTSDTDMSRTDAWISVISNLTRYPLGGKGVDLSVGYAHNMWLDVAYEGGFLPLIILLAFSIMALFTIVRMFRDKNPLYFKKIVALMLTAFVTIFMLEPVLEGLTAYFMFFCFLLGGVYKINYLNKIK